MPNSNRKITANCRKRGFGLLEVLLSGVIVIIILGALVLIGRAAMTNNEYNQERAQAIYLAQEGLETVRQIRDTQWIDRSNTTGWDKLSWNNSTSSWISVADNTCYQLPSALYDAGHLIAKRWYLSMPLSSCSASGQDINLGLAPSSVTYNRKIQIARNASIQTLIPVPSGSALYPYAVKVISKVTWTYNGQSKTISVSELLTNWRPNF